MDRSCLSTTGFSTGFRKDMSSQIFRATVVYNFIKLTKSLIPSDVGKSLPVKFLKYLVNASSMPGSSFDQEQLSKHVLP